MSLKLCIICMEIITVLIIFFTHNHGSLENNEFSSFVFTIRKTYKKIFTQ